MNITITNATDCAAGAWPKTPIAIGMVVYLINLLVGFPLNCYVMKLYLTRGTGQDGAVIFAVSQSVVEIIFCTAAPISVLCYLGDELSFQKPLGFITGACMGARSLFQCCICVERYLAVVHPVTFLNYKPIRYRLRCAAVVCTCALASGITCTLNLPGMPLWIIGIMYSIILFTDVFCCVSILKALLHPGPGEGPMEDTAMNATKKRAFELVSVNLLTLLVQIVPSAIIFAFQNYFSCPFFFTVATSSTFFSNIVAGFVQPVFFLHQAGKLGCMGS